MNIRELDDRAWLEHPTTWPNNRGVTRDTHIPYGLPPPKIRRQADGGFREDDEAKKGGDRIGFKPVVITPDMVGQKVAIFVSIEEKTVNDRLSIGQKNWHHFVLENGGISEIWQVQKDGEIEIIKGKIE
jgi:hypothetical protein